jgi:hypothetical protein
MSDKDLSNYLTNTLSVAPPVIKYRELLLKTAAEFIGVSRQNNLMQVARFLDIFGLPTKLDGKWVPFCAAGLSYAGLKAYCDFASIPYSAENAPEVFKTRIGNLQVNFFYPSPSCGFIMNHAKQKGNWIDKKDSANQQILPGYLVLFNWKGGEWPDHIGIVEKYEDKLHTIEFNTSDSDNINGGSVARRERNYDCVLGYVKI